MSRTDELEALAAKAREGGAPKYHQANAAAGMLFCRERSALLCDDGGKDCVEDGLLGHHAAGDLPADGVVTGVGRVHGRPVAIMANDSTVKAGSWGARTVEKIIRIQETAGRLRIPLVYLVDSAGARITDQLDMFPGRRHAGRMGVKIAAMYRGSPRMAEMVIGEKVTLEEMGGARMHCEVSGCGDLLAPDERACLESARAYLAYLPARSGEAPPVAPPRSPRAGAKRLAALLPANQNQAFDIHAVIEALTDEGSFFELKRLFARELVTGFARIDGQPVGIVASQPKWKGGVLFVDSADKAARFIWLCDAFGIPLLFLADVPGFMIGKAVERQGIIRHGAKMISAVADATVPKICVVLRKAYGAGLSAMCGPGFEPDATLALPQAMIAVMGAEAAVNAVYANKIAAQPEAERAAYVEQLRHEYREDIALVKLASNLHVDAVVPGDSLRGELLRRYAAAAGKRVTGFERRRAVLPVCPWT